MKHLDGNSYVDALQSVSRPFQSNYYAMYSGIIDGIVNDPAFMTIPIDDHLVHRGDGIFETLKCVDGMIYNMEAHLDRLHSSASDLDFNTKHDDTDIARIVTETVRAGGHRDCLIRILISRGPGSFGVNPYDCPENMLYVTVSKLPDPFMKTHPEGAALITTSISIKPAFLAGIKSCNYIPNVLMKREAIKAGAHYTVSFDDDDNLAEGATENIGIVTPDNELLFPDSHVILRGTTMMRVIELAQNLVEAGELTFAGCRNISRSAFVAAPEILIVGTTCNVTSVTSYDGSPVSNGKPGPVGCRLDDILEDDINNNPALQTRAFPE